MVVADGHGVVVAADRPEDGAHRPGPDAADPPEQDEPSPFAGKTMTGSAKTMGGGSFDIGVDVDLPGDRFDFGASTEVPIPSLEDTTEVAGEITGFAMSPGGSLLRLHDWGRSQLPEEVQPFAMTPTELLAAGGQKLADQIPEGPAEPTLDDGPGALIDGYMRNNLRDGITTLTGLPQGLVDMPKQISTDVSNASEDLFRWAGDMPAREGTEQLPGETGLERYTRNYPFTGGFANLGVNMYDRY